MGTKIGISVGRGFRALKGLSHLTIDHACVPKRSTVPIPTRGTSKTWAFIQQGVGGCTQFVHGRTRMTIDHYAGTEHVGFSQTRQALLAPSAKRREVFGKSNGG